jgi:hypothetical protein
VWRSRTPDGVRCAHFPIVVTTIIDQKVQLINPLNLGELYAAWQNLFFKHIRPRPLINDQGARTFSNINSNLRRNSNF